jgi:hypothetical protein
VSAVETLHHSVREGTDQHWLSIRVVDVGHDGSVGLERRKSTLVSVRGLHWWCRKRRHWPRRSWRHLGATRHGSASAKRSALGRRSSGVREWRLLRGVRVR